MESSLELTRRSDLTLAPHNDRYSEAICGGGLVAVIAVVFFMSLLPLSSILWLTGVGASFAGLAVVSRARSSAMVVPEDILDPVLRETYRAIHAARGELERTLAGAPGLASAAPSLNARCADAVQSCARIVPIANRLHAYLSSHEEWQIAREAAQLRLKAASIRDESIVRDLGNAAAAYDRQLAVCEELARTRERIQARLELVLASLRSFTATVVKQQVAEEEQVALAGESLSEHVDGVRQELAVLESALELDLAA